MGGESGFVYDAEISGELRRTFAMGTLHDASVRNIFVSLQSIAIPHFFQVVQRGIRDCLFLYLFFTTTL